MTNLITVVRWVAKALVAVIGVFIAAIVAGTLDVEPWVEVTLQAVTAGILVFLVPNGAAPAVEG